MQPDIVRKKYRDAVLILAARYRADTVRLFTVAGKDPAEELHFLVRFLPEASLLDEVGLERELQELLGEPVQVVADDTLSGTYGETILAKAVAL